jgi:nucleoside-diphosphate-sugar epimerase
MTYFVSGYRGFVGGYLMSYLKSKKQKSVGFEFGDRLELINQMNPEEDFFIHLADPNSIHFTALRMYSIEGELLQIADRMGPRLIYASSSLVYCRTGSKSKAVTDATCPQDAYAAFKIEREEKLRNLGSTILRFGNIYGLGMSTNTIIYRILASLKGKGSITFDRNPTRDFLNISDAVHALYLFGRYPVDTPKTYNIGSGMGTSISTIYDMCQEIVGVFTEKECNFPDSKLSLDQIILKLDGLNAPDWWQPKVSFERGIQTVAQDIFDKLVL